MEQSLNSLALQQASPFDVLPAEIWQIIINFLPIFSAKKFTAVHRHLLPLARSAISKRLFVRESLSLSARNALPTEIIAEGSFMTICCGSHLVLSSRPNTHNNVAQITVRILHSNYKLWYQWKLLISPRMFYSLQPVDAHPMISMMSSDLVQTQAADSTHAYRLSLKYYNYSGAQVEKFDLRQNTTYLQSYHITRNETQHQVYFLETYCSSVYDLNKNELLYRITYDLHASGDAVLSVLPGAHMHGGLLWVLGEPAYTPRASKEVRKYIHQYLYILYISTHV